MTPTSASRKETPADETYHPDPEISFHPSLTPATPNAMPS
jgi:hypothetical protein